MMRPLWLAARSLAYWNPERHEWVIESDSVHAMVGSSSADVRLSRTIKVQR